MRWVKSSLALLVGFMGLGTASCSDTAASKSLSPDSGAPTVSFNKTMGEGPSDQEVTGGVSFLVNEGFGSFTPARYEMAAIRHNGTVKGELVVRFSRDIEQIVWADIVCFSTAGHSAFLAART